ncbi:hypothetical protein ACFL0N_01080 [Pseudomonadota bacterium]
MRAIFLAFLLLILTPMVFAGDSYNDITQTAEMQKQTREMQKQSRIMQQQYQDQKNQQAQQQLNQIQQNSSQMQGGLNKYSNYPNVLSAAIELQEVQMAYLNTQQTRMPGGSIAAGIEGLADAVRAKKARKKVSKAQKKLAKAIREADKDMANSS